MAPKGTPLSQYKGLIKGQQQHSLSQLEERAMWEHISEAIKTKCYKPTPKIISSILSDWILHGHFTIKSLEAFMASHNKFENVLQSMINEVLYHNMCVCQVMPNGPQEIHWNLSGDFNFDLIWKGYFRLQREFQVLAEKGRTHDFDEANLRRAHITSKVELTTLLDIQISVGDTCKIMVDAYAGAIVREDGSLFLPTAACSKAWKKKHNADERPHDTPLEHYIKNKLPATAFNPSKLQRLERVLICVQSVGPQATSRKVRKELKDATIEYRILLEDFETTLSNLKAFAPHLEHAIRDAGGKEGNKGG